MIQVHWGNGATEHV